jgi:transposase
LGAEARQQVASWLEEGRNRPGEPIFWTLQKLMLAIETEFGVSLGQTATWGLVRQWGFRQKLPRPRHAKADKQAQESFKKNL